jgi:general stress protein 26
VHEINNLPAWYRVLYETEAELSELETLVEKSRSRSGDHLSSLFGQGEWLSGKQVAHRLQGIGNVALATVNSRLEPRVAPMEAVLFHGKFYIALQSDSTRVRQLTKTPAASLTYTRDDDVLITVNGNATFVQRGEPDFARLEAEWSKKYGRSVWDALAFIKLEPTHIVAFALNPELFPTA